MQDSNTTHPRTVPRYIRGGSWHTKFDTSLNRDHCGPGCEDDLQGFRTFRTFRGVRQRFLDPQ